MRRYAVESNRYLQSDPLFYCIHCDDASLGAAVVANESLALGDQLLVHYGTSRSCVGRHLYGLWRVARGSGVLLCILLLLPLFISAAVAGGAENGTGEAVIGLALFLPVWILMEFILGFPSRNLFVLEPPEPKPDEPASPEQPELMAAIGTVATPLRPTGRIEIDGSQYAATTVDATFIDVGCQVQVCGSRSSLFVVRPIDAAKEETTQEAGESEGVNQTLA